MANFDFDELRQKAISTAETIADVSAELYKKAENKTKVIAKKTKINSEIAKDKNALRRAYTELGKKYYASYISAPHEDLAPDCDAIKEIIDRINANTDALNELKDGVTEGEEDIDVEIIIDDGEETAPEAEEEPSAEEAVKEAVEDIVEEVVEPVIEESKTEE